jgi:hypothetical protein
MNKKVCAVVFFSSLFTLSQAAEWQPDPGFTSLFNGTDLTGWCFLEKGSRKEPKNVTPRVVFDGKTESNDNGRYSVKDGVLSVNYPKGRARLMSKLYTTAEFSGDFVLKLEFRASINADSGIFIRKPQLQCRDYLVAGPFKELKKYRPQEWNQIEVVVADNVAHATCNGEVLGDAMTLPASGPIGLEGDRGQMEYRHIQIKAAK